MAYRICFISTSGYPYKDDTSSIFFKNLVDEFADNGFECVVVAPQSKLKALRDKNPKRPERLTIRTKKGNEYLLLSPSYIAFSNRELLFFSTQRLDYYSSERAVKKALKGIGIFDAYYGHFFYAAGFIAAALGRQNKKPSYIANGESNLPTNTYYCKNSYLYKKWLKYVSGVISVSSDNKREILDKGYMPFEDKNKIGVFVNGVDKTLFKPIERRQARAKLGFDQNVFIVIFVGHFNERKGVLRLSEAVSNIPDVKVIYLGKGTLMPATERALYVGQVSHDDLPIYLSASDVFVLPTLAEGCSNAIIEALSCGLPVISSDLPFNDDVLNNNNSIRINPNNAREIERAISLLKKDSELKKHLSEGALETAKYLTIEERVHKIIQFMKLNQEYYDD